MQKLGVVRNDGVLLNATNALFGFAPTMHHIPCKVRLARFESANKLVFRDQAMCEGNQFKQHDAVSDFCLKNTPHCAERVLIFCGANPGARPMRQLQPRCLRHWERCEVD